MKNYASLSITLLMMCIAPSATWAQGYQPVTPLYSQQDMSATGQAPTAIPLSVTADKALGQLMVEWPADTISFNQLQSIITQFPGMNKLKVQFPNQTQWMVSPAELTSLRNQYMEQAGSLGFGVGGGGIPDLVFSSLANQSGGAGALAMIPIATLKDGMTETLEPMLREMRYQQLALSDSLPDWLRDILLALYNAIMPLYYGAVEWVSSFF
jgi:hypothetical protein